MNKEPYLQYAATFLDKVGGYNITSILRDNSPRHSPYAIEFEDQKGHKGICIAREYLWTPSQNPKIVNSGQGALSSFDKEVVDFCA